MSQVLETFLEYNHPGNVPVWEKLTFTKELVNGEEEIRPISSEFYYGPEDEKSIWYIGYYEDGPVPNALGRQIRKFASEFDFIGIWNINEVQHVYYKSDEEGTPKIIVKKGNEWDYEFEHLNYHDSTGKESERLYIQEIDIDYDLDEDGVIGYPDPEKYIQLYDFLSLTPQPTYSQFDPNATFHFDFTGSDVDETILIRGDDKPLEAYADGKGGNDKIDVDTDFVIDYMEAYGGDGDDTIKAKAIKSHIFGGNGNDTISVKGNNYQSIDNEVSIYIHGGNGNDVIQRDNYFSQWWGSGDAIGWLGEGDDEAEFPVLMGEAGSDVLTGFKLSGGEGNDELTQPLNSIGYKTESAYLFGGGGDDILKLNNYQNTVPTIELSSGKDNIILDTRGEFKLLINSTIYGNDHTITSKYDPDANGFYMLIEGGGIETRIAVRDSEFLRRRIFYVEGPEENGDSLEVVPEKPEDPIVEDKIYIPPVVSRIFEGTQKADKLKGKKTNDQLMGYGGDDNLNGKKGSDILIGEKGDDTLKGSKGADYLLGGKGSDQLIGGKGPDVFKVSKGTDFVKDFSLKQGDRVAIDVDDEYTVGSYGVVGGSSGSLITVGTKKALFIEGLSISEFNENINELIVRVDSTIN